MVFWPLFQVYFEVVLWPPGLWMLAAAILLALVAPLSSYGQCSGLVKIHSLCLQLYRAFTDRPELLEKLKHSIDGHRSRRKGVLQVVLLFVHVPCSHVGLCWSAVLMLSSF